MEYQSYSHFLENAVSKFSALTVKRLIKILSSRGIITEDNQIELDRPDIIDVSNFNSMKEKLLHAISSSNEAVRVVENWEFIKAYKYSIIFETETDLENLNIKFYIDSGNIFPENTLDHEAMYSIVTKPIYYQQGDIILLKFLLRQEFHEVLTGDEILNKYTIVVALHTDLNIVEIRFDATQSIGQSTALIYMEMVKAIRNWLRNTLSIQTIAFPLNDAINSVTDPLRDDIVVAGKNYKFVDGSTADLFSNRDEVDYSLPFISEIRDIIQQYAEELEQCPKIRQVLIDYLKEKEDDSNSDWIMITWKDEIKSHKICIKCTFNYYEQDYDQIMHYSNALIDMEKMNHVTRYLVNNYRNRQIVES